REFQGHGQPGALRGLLLRPLSSRRAEKRPGSRRYRRTPRRHARPAIKFHPRDRTSPRAISSRPLRGFGHEIASKRRKGDLRGALRASLRSATAPAFSAKWLNRLTAYLRVRLATSIGLGDDRELSQLLFERRARVFITSTHVDVLFELADLPVQVRLSG